MRCNFRFKHCCLASLPSPFLKLQRNHCTACMEDERSHNELELTRTLSKDFIRLTVNGIRYPCSFNMEQNSTGGCVKIYFLSLFTSKLYERLPLKLPTHNNFQWSVSYSLLRSITVNCFPYFQMFFGVTEHERIKAHVYTITRGYC